VTARLTFLRRHVAQQRDLRADSLDWEGLEVFRTLRRRDGTTTPSLHHFFRGSATLPRLYHPVPLELHPGDADAGEAAEDGELSALLARLHEQRHDRGVLLFGPGGAGKSVAMRKAFFDCLDRSTELGRTGLVPCWLHLRRTSAAVTLPDLFRDAVEPHVSLSEQAAWDWLDAGPPVLLLCDLDDPLHVPADRRASLASQLATLQGNDQFSRRNHRIVVAYRSSGTLCPVAGTLHAGRRFRRHRLLELDVDAVLGYLTDLRAWHEALGTAAATPIELPAWRSFVERMERRPLLMHLLGSYCNSLAGPPPTAGRLVARLVEEQIASAVGHLPEGLLDRLPSNPQKHNLRSWMLTGLVRASRLGWSQGQPSALSPGQHLYDVLQDPHTHLPAWPASNYWHGSYSPYWHNEPGLDQYLMALVDLIHGSPWVSRPDDHTYRVGPELFANFFAAVLPVRYRLGPPLSLANAPPPLPDADVWLDEVVALWQQHLDAWAGAALHDHGAWQQGAALLAGLLSEQEYFALVRAWLLCSDPQLVRLGLALLHGRHPAEPPSPPQCPPELFERLLDALESANQTDHVTDPLTLCHELLADELRPALAEFAGHDAGGGPSG
jgi:hypothetical protein